MFETLFSAYPTVLRRHREGPLAAERAAHLEKLAAQSMARSTLLHRARYCLCVAIELQRWPSGQRFAEREIDALASEWAAQRVRIGRAGDPRWPAEQFRHSATEFIRDMGRLCAVPACAPSRYEEELARFLTARQECSWPAESTRRSAAWQIRRFLTYLEQQGTALEDVAAEDIDAYFQLMGHRWSRRSLHTSATLLRAWFAYCEARGSVRRGVTAAILLPRLYRHEGLPLGPTWEEVGHMLADTTSEVDPVKLRDHAILLLLSVYGWRSGEVRRLGLDDIDWRQERIRVIRSKSGRQETLPLDPSVGNAIVRYLQHARPRSDSRTVFLTVRAPYRAISQGGLYTLVVRRLSKVSTSSKHRGPHGLRHALRTTPGRGR